MKKLKFCPFCGGQAKLNTEEMIPYEKMNILNNDGLWYYVECANCHVWTSQELTPSEAIKYWNRRT